MSMLEDGPMFPDICIYHSPCADGFTAAWAIRKRFGVGVKFVPGVYGEVPPDVSGANVLLVDFSYKRPVLDKMAQTAKSIIILDHHKTAAEDLAPFRVEMCGSARFSADDVGGMLRDLSELDRPPIIAEFDMERSGAQMAWDYCFPNDRRPNLVDYVADRDLWRFLLPQSREVAAFVFSYDYSFKNWDFLDTFMRYSSGVQDAAEHGGAIERKHHKDIGELLKATRRTMLIGGIDVPVANLPYTMASDAAGAMAQDAPFAACYFDRWDARVFSLRSRVDGADVSEIAKAYGGGGHKNAAGFQAPVGREGDEVVP